MNLAQIILIDGISYAGWLFLVSIGLTLVFGVLRLLNIAHGGFYALGAYVAAYAIGLAAQNGFGVGVQLLVALVGACGVGGLVGLLVERTVLRRLYDHPEVLTLFATYAVFLILEDVTKLVFGGQPIYAFQPRNAFGMVDLGPLAYPVYDVATVAVAALVAAAVWFVLNRTKTGRCVIAVVNDREMAASMGVNVTAIMIGTFVVGTALGAFAGAITAPKIAVAPGIGVEVVVLAFAVIVIGGLGSIGGAVVGALVVGIARAAATHLAPDFAVFAVYAAMAVVLTIRPYGLFARPMARKI
ncbi:branched-chain amino acid ABC transporter permease [Acuticoccus sp. I52.16.1]|uniref:branched-chain amino acid ABC transporter permease n=1 Tax=Acuticoccus sp. I52.16.1 TaxID=2928472 RepID=UPI001FD26F86|nr:branched-chain amino acid ABC transporter permease [Acuticoccus sp. I52.16.1]UOM37170.1 branched-chain amino acid ABC transporter permease [Acuticoccus sp. I52.16.1]